MHPLTWFQERIGKVVERGGIGTFQRQEQILIRDDFHARYLHMIQCDFHADGVELNYRDANE